MKAVEIHLRNTDKTVLINPDAVASLSVIEPRPTHDDAEPKPYSVIELTSGTRWEVTDDAKKLRRALFG